MKSEEDASLFDTRFTKMTPVDSPCDSTFRWALFLHKLLFDLWFDERCLFFFSLTGDNPFVGFTYVAPSVLEAMNQPDPPLVTRARSPRKGNL